MNKALVYDGSFIGYLSLVFDIYQSKCNPSSIDTPEKALNIFAQELITPVVDETQAERVANGILKRAGKNVARFIYKCFLSEQDGVEMKLLYLIRHVLCGRGYKISDFSDEQIMDLHKIKKMMNREVHRMHAFVRFQETKDDIWSCEIQPDFNVLPLIGKHFKDRYPAQSWLIYDRKRSYGIYYESQKEIEFIQFNGIDDIEKLIKPESITDSEKDYQAMWKQYFESVNIKERNNPKLHIQHVPRRYWKYLIEKA